MRENLEKIINTYGEQAQIDIAIEEMSELTKALLKHRRAKIKDPIIENDIAEEMADVKIMLEQLEIIFNNTEDVKEYMNFKVERQLQRISEGE